jgi:hypothetical protein
MSSGESPPGKVVSVLAKASPVLYVAACVVAVVIRPRSFLVVWMAAVIIYHGILVQAAFLSVTPTPGEMHGPDGHWLLRAYRRAAPVLAAVGLLLHFVDVPSLGEQTPGLLVATGAAMTLAVKMIRFAGTDARY